MPVADLTRHFTDAAIDWELPPRKFLPQFASEVRGFTKGVYVLFAVNDSRKPIHDRNEHQAEGGRINVPAGGMVVKYGKYEDGIARRERTNYQHWHRQPNESGIFPSCIRMLLAAHLEDAQKQDIRAAESALRLTIRGLLHERGWEYPAQPYPRMESRWIGAEHRGGEDLVKSAVRAAFNRLAKERRW